MTLTASVRDTLTMIRFSHSIFALPFALLSLFLASGGWPTAHVLAWVLVAMVSARSAAMGVNRLADRRFDAANPRTAGRELVTGRLSVAFVTSFTLVCVVLFLVAAWQINLTALVLSPIVLVVLLGYSFLKRVTPLAHFGVGVALGLSPLGAWIAGAGGLVGPLAVPLVMGAGVLCWVTGFDVIYACQDAEVDRQLGLHSLPARLGVPRALVLSRLLHGLCVVCFALVGVLAGLGWIYGGAVVLVAALLVVEHRMVSAKDLSRVNAAFFTVNGVVALVLGAAGIVDLLV